jgi:hypothetical protein
MLVPPYSARSWSMRNSMMVRGERIAGGSGSGMSIEGVTVTSFATIMMR